jgi:hypothetical protein
MIVSSVKCQGCKNFFIATNSIARFFRIKIMYFYTIQHSAVVVLAPGFIDKFLIILVLYLIK